MSNNLLYYNTEPGNEPGERKGTQTMTTIKNQNFGIEIELTGITRVRAAEIIAAYYGTNATRHHECDGYDTSRAMDRKNRWWKCSRDVSIRPERKQNNRTISVPEGRTHGDLRCEVVSPILQYEDIEDLQNIVRELVKSGAMANDSCGIHVHVDGANHTADSLINLVNLFTGRQDLFYEALQNITRAERWCQKASKEMMKAMRKGEHSKEAIERVYYSQLNNGYRGGIDHSHYCNARYRGLNLHALYTKGTVEFRLFNGTTHAGKIKAYIQFCLAMSAWAINADKAKVPFFKDTGDFTMEQKAKIMSNFLKNRLQMSGKEFETARHHLTAAFRNVA